MVIRNVYAGNALVAHRVEYEKIEIRLGFQSPLLDARDFSVRRPAQNIKADFRCVNKPVMPVRVRFFKETVRKTLRNPESFKPDVSDFRRQ